MREAVWLGSALLTELLPHAYYALGGLTTRAGKRRLRLFGCACCRRVWEWLTDERSRYAVEVSERFADGEAGRDGLARAEEAATAALTRLRSHYPRDPDAAPLRPRHLREAAQAAVYDQGRGRGPPVPTLARHLRRPLAPPAAEKGQTRLGGPQASLDRGERGAGP